jgi:RimJ/RimL family protein N-acetyltransferase
MADDPSLTIINERVALGSLRRESTPFYFCRRNDFHVQPPLGYLLAPIALEGRATWSDAAATSTDALWITISVLEDMRLFRMTDLFAFDYRLGTCRFEMLIGEASARGKGTETARLMLDAAFTALGWHDVMLTVSAYNLAGRRA